MDTNDLIAHSRAKFDHAAAKRVLKEKYQAKMIFGYRGGMFSAGPELLTLLQAVPIEDDIVILDLYENPIKINPGELQHIAFDRWQEQMTAWLLEFETKQPATMNKGVLLFAHDSGDVKYTEFAAWSARRIHHHLDVPVSIVTDKPIADGHPFDQIIIADAESNSYRNSVPWRNMGRYRAGELTPYDHTILLDVDYVVCSNQLSALFEINQPLVSMRWAYDISGRNNYQGLNYFGKNKMPSAWATVISWKRSHTANLVFGMMEMVQKNWQHYLNLYGVHDSKFRNDYALAIASNTVWGHTGLWPSIPWSMPNVEERLDLTQIAHNEFDVKYVDQQSKSRKITLRNMDFHAMGKRQLGAIVGS